MDDHAYVRQVLEASQRVFDNLGVGSNTGGGEETVGLLETQTGHSQSLVELASPKELLWRAGYCVHHSSRLDGITRLGHSMSQDDRAEGPGD